MLTISAQIKILVFKKQVFQNTRSILQTVQSLIKADRYFVAILLTLFSLVIPFVKGLLLLVVPFLKGKKRVLLFRFCQGISKWAMTDVFVIGIFVAFLAAEGTRNMTAEIQPGFYYFAIYCLLSLTALQFIKLDHDTPIPPLSDTEITAPLS